MSKQTSAHKLKIIFVAKMGVSGKYDKDGRKKYHVMIPRQHIDKIENLNLEGKQVKVTIEDEI
jgi:hypothetical protein